jgi:hypothetical protein
MKIHHILNVCLFTTMMSGAGSLSAQHNYKADTILFIQGTNVHSIARETDSITLDRQEFHIRFNALRYDTSKNVFTGLQLAVMDHPDYSIHSGMDAEKTSCFRLGMGMANSDNNLLIIANDANNYIIYQDEHERRADLISQNGENLILDIDVKAFDVPVSDLDSKKIEVKDTKMKSLWFVMWYDWNANLMIDKGELKKVHIRFK